MEKGQIVITVIVIVVLTGLVTGSLWYIDREEAPRRAAYTALARCLDDAGATFYGAFWCPVCATQKNIFGTVADKLPYVECSTPNRTAQTQVCQDENIQSYPTWEFKDGTRCTGSIDPNVLAHLTDCPLPVYDGVSYSVPDMYTTLVEDVLRKRIAENTTDAEEIDRALEGVRTSISNVLQSEHGTTLEETTNLHHLFGVVAKELHQCTPKAVEEVVEENVLEDAVEAEA